LIDWQDRRVGKTMAKNRERTVVTQEGWYYLFILGFVILGSMLRNIQLLVGLSAILATGMIFNWRWTRASLRGLDIRRLPIGDVWANRPVSFSVQVVNRRRRMSTFSLIVSQCFRQQRLALNADEQSGWAGRVMSWMLGKQMRQQVLLDAVHVGQTRVADQTMEFERRGAYRRGPLRVFTHFPLGLVRREWTDSALETVYVGPALGSLSQQWVDQMLGLGWKDSQLATMARMGDDFYSLRPYSSGDSRRWIHWRASARHRTLLVRQFQANQSKAFSLVVDLLASGPGDTPAVKAREASAVGAGGGRGPRSSRRSGPTAETEKMLRIAATVSEAVYRGGIQSVTLVVVGSQPCEIRFPCTESVWQQWRQALALVVPTTDRLALLNRLLSDSSRVQGESERRVGNTDPGGAASPRPVPTARADWTGPLVILSPRNMEEFVAELRGGPGRDSGDLTEGKKSGGGLPDESTRDPMTDQASTGGQSASVAEPRLDRAPDPLESFWGIQRLIRTWITPGDRWLSSWYFDREQPVDDSGGEGRDADTVIVERGPVTGESSSAGQLQPQSNGVPS